MLAFIVLGLLAVVVAYFVTRPGKVDNYKATDLATNDAKAVAEEKAAAKSAKIEVVVKK